MTLRSVRLLLGSVVLTASVTLAACGAGRSRDRSDTVVDADASLTDDAAGADGADLAGDAPPDGEVEAGSDAGCACGSSPSKGCVDLRVDDENCGACGQGCAAEATCNAGVCGPTPTIIEPSRTTACGGLDLAVAGTTLFWADKARGEVLRASATVGAPTAIATLEDSPRALAVGGDEVFWLAGGQPMNVQVVPGLAIRAASVGGGLARTVISRAEGVDAFTVTADGRTVYYSTSTRIEKTAAAAQTAPIVVMANAARGDVPVGLGLDGSTLAFIGEFSGDVDAAMLVDGQVATCAPVQTFDPASAVLCLPVGRDINGRTLVAAGGMAYFHDGAMMKQGPLNGGYGWFSPTTIAEVDGWLTDIAMSSDALFFSDSGSSDDGISMSSDGTVLKLPLPAGEQSVPSRLARAQNAPLSVATDGARVYWSTADCAIKAVAIR